MQSWVKLVGVIVPTVVSNQARCGFLFLTVAAPAHRWASGSRTTAARSGSPRSSGIERTALRARCTSRPGGIARPRRTGRTCRPSCTPSVLRIDSNHSLVAGASQAEVAVAGGCIIGSPPVRVLQTHWSVSGSHISPELQLRALPHCTRYRAARGCSLCPAYEQSEFWTHSKHRPESVSQWSVGSGHPPPRLRRARNGRKPGVLLEVEHLGVRVTRAAPPDRERDEPPAGTKTRRATRPRHARTPPGRRGRYFFAAALPLAPSRAERSRIFSPWRSRRARCRDTRRESGRTRPELRPQRRALPRHGACKGVVLRGQGRVGVDAEATFVVDQGDKPFATERDDDVVASAKPQSEAISPHAATRVSPSEVRTTTTPLGTRFSRVVVLPRTVASRESTSTRKEVPLTSISASCVRMTNLWPAPSLATSARSEPPRVRRAGRRFVDDGQIAALFQGQPRAGGERKESAAIRGGNDVTPFAQNWTPSPSRGVGPPLATTLAPAPIGWATTTTASDVVLRKPRGAGRRSTSAMRRAERGEARIRRRVPPQRPCSPRPPEPPRRPRAAGCANAFGWRPPAHGWRVPAWLGGAARVPRPSEERRRRASVTGRAHDLSSSSCSPLGELAVGRRSARAARDARGRAATAQHSR